MYNSNWESNWFSGVSEAKNIFFLHLHIHTLTEKDTVFENTTTKSFNRTDNQAQRRIREVSVFVWLKVDCRKLSNLFYVARLLFKHVNPSEDRSATLPFRWKPNTLCVPVCSQWSLWRFSSRPRTNKCRLTNVTTWNASRQVRGQRQSLHGGKTVVK